MAVVLGALAGNRVLALCPHRRDDDGMFLYTGLVVVGMDVLHTAIWVDDIEAQLEFYCDGLGLERTREFDLDGVTNTYVAGESDAEIQFKHDGTERDPKPAQIDHLAVGIDDIDGTVDDLVEHYGSEVVEGPRTVDEKDIRLAFVTAPEGYVVELIETLED